MLGYLGPGAYFGETGLESTAATGPSAFARREKTVTAMVDSELAYLQISDLDQLRQDFPVLRRHIQTYTELRQKLELPKNVFNVIDQDDDGSIQTSELYELMFQLDMCVASKKINLVVRSW